MNNREMLELAAKAAGYELSSGAIDTSMLFVRSPNGGMPWNPIENDGDAFRLAVKLRINKWHNHACVTAEECAEGARVNQEYGDDPFAATRLAITRAAAQIGASIK